MRLPPTRIWLTQSYSVNILYVQNIGSFKILFIWDNSKATTNLKKHGVTFEEAQTVFEDDNALRIFDPDHSDTEDRFLLLGLSALLRMLVVCHCYRENDEQIRIISARKSTKKEEQAYGRRKSHA